MNNPLEVNPGNVWQYRQNKPIHVARDLHRIFGVPIKATLKILMARGVCKWLAVRRDLIRVKNVWKAEITDTLIKIKMKKVILKETHKDNNRAHCELWYLRGYLKAMEICRADIRAMCHSERWRFPDHDSASRKLIFDDNNNDVSRG